MIGVRKRTAATTPAAKSHSSPQKVNPQPYTIRMESSFEFSKGKFLANAVKKTEKERILSGELFASANGREPFLPTQRGVPAKRSRHRL